MAASAPVETSGYSLFGSGLEGIEFSMGAPERSSGRVTRLSPTVAWVVPAGPDDTPPGQRCELYLKSRGTLVGPLRGQVRGSGAAASGEPLAIELVGVSLAQGRQILAMLGEALRRGLAEPAASVLPVSEEIVDSERIRTVLYGIAAVSNKGVLRQVGRTVRVVLEQCDSEAGLLYWSTEEQGVEWGAPPYDIDVVGYNSAYRLQLESVTPRDGLRVSELPQQLWRIRHRWHRRVPAPPLARLRFEHPLWSERGTVELDVIDISLGGLRVAARPEDVLFPGMQLPRLALEVGEEAPLLLRGEVRYTLGRGESGVCGVSVTPLPAHEARWVRFVSQVLCPTTHTSENLIRPLWELFLRSGYFNLGGKSAEHFEEAKLGFIHQTLRAAHLPQLFCQTVWPSERGIEATNSLMKPYRHTWMMHQLAKRPGKPPTVVQGPGQILRDLYLRTFEHATSDPEHRWCLAYVEANNPFLERAHLRYARRLMPTHPDVYTAPLRVMSARCEGAAPPSGLLDIGPATAEERALLCAELSRSRPGCYVEALDLTPERMDLGDICRLWKGFGLARGREILVARRRDGTPLAALVLEVGEPGTNLFGLLDAARLFPLSPEASESYVELLDEARRWYARQGRTSFKFLREDDDASYAGAARLEDSADAEPHLWLIPAGLVPEFLEHINELTVGRKPRVRQTE